MATLIRSIFIVALLATACAVAEEVTTIVGSGKGPVLIIEPNGKVQQIETNELTLQKAPGVGDAPKAAPEKSAKAATDEKAIAEAKAKEKAAGEAAAKAKAEVEKEKKTKAKELQRYADKDYTYGPGSATKADKTGATLESAARNRPETPSERRIADKKAEEAKKVEAVTNPKVQVGGEIRVRANTYKK